MLADFKISQCVKMLSRTFSNMFLRFPEDNLKIIMILKFLKLEPPATSKDVQIKFLWYLLSYIPTLCALMIFLCRNKIIRKKKKKIRQIVLLKTLVIFLGSLVCFWHCKSFDLKSLPRWYEVKTKTAQIHCNLKREKARLLLLFSDNNSYNRDTVVV